MSSDLWQVTWFTAWVAVTSTLVILPPGIALAWLLARRQWPGKSIVETLVALPLVIPPVATGLILLHLFGRRGLLGHWLENSLGIEIVFTWKAVVIATAVMSFPLLVRTARGVRGRPGPSSEDTPRLGQVAPACRLRVKNGY